MYADPLPQSQIVQTPHSAVYLLRSASGELARCRLERVLELIATHLDEQLPLERMARAAGLSRMHFAAQFRRWTGQSPHGFVRRCRIAEACRLLRDTELPIVQVALATGFQTQAHFTTVFGSCVGSSPGAWRKKSRATSSTDRRNPS